MFVLFLECMYLNLALFFRYKGNNLFVRNFSKSNTHIWTEKNQTSNFQEFKQNIGEFTIN